MAGFATVFKINWLKTIYLNFRYFSLAEALKLPIFVYRGVKIRSSRGNIVVKGDLSIGMLKIGPNGVGTIDTMTEPTIWQSDGTLVLHGKAMFGVGSRLCIGKGAELSLGKDFMITGRSTIICGKRIAFGNDCLLSWDILMMDTDLHKVTIPLEGEKKVINNAEQITVGNHVWIGCRNTILKGVSIPDNTVVAANSTITKSFFEENTIIGASNKVLKTGISWEQ
ncbi:MAG: hypothetical protein MJZ19_03635 [Paludibacteraceae bacterium]|nr:hypothetical protein [Paludibacteraceae bacterium]